MDNEIFREDSLHLVMLSVEDFTLNPFDVSGNIQLMISILWRNKRDGFLLTMCCSTSRAIRLCLKAKSTATQVRVY